MHDLPRQKLTELLAQYGPGFCDDEKRLEAMLNVKIELRTSSVRLFHARTTTAPLFCAALLRNPPFSHSNRPMFRFPLQLLKKETRLLGGSRVMGKDSIWVTGLMPNTAREGERF